MTHTFEFISKFLFLYLISEHYLHKARKSKKEKSLSPEGLIKKYDEVPVLIKETKYELMLQGN